MTTAAQLHRLARTTDGFAVLTDTQFAMLSRAVSGSDRDAQEVAVAALEFGATSPSFAWREHAVDLLQMVSWQGGFRTRKARTTAARAWAAIRGGKR